MELLSTVSGHGKTGSWISAQASVQGYARWRPFNHQSSILPPLSTKAPRKFFSYTASSGRKSAATELSWVNLSATICIGTLDLSETLNLYLVHRIMPSQISRPKPNFDKNHSGENFVTRRMRYHPNFIFCMSILGQEKKAQDFVADMSHGI